MHSGKEYRDPTGCIMKRKGTRRTDGKLFLKVTE
jgi:hypothetical protein